MEAVALVGCSHLGVGLLCHDYGLVVVGRI